MEPLPDGEHRKACEFVLGEFADGTDPWLEMMKEWCLHFSMRMHFARWILRPLDDPGRYFIRLWWGWAAILAESPPPPAPK